MKMKATAPLVLALALLAGCSTKPSPKVIRGTVVSCWESRALMDVLTTSGELKHLDVNFKSMPGCAAFSRGGEWTINYHDTGVGTVAIDRMQWEGK